MKIQKSILFNLIAISSSMIVSKSELNAQTCSISNQTVTAVNPSFCSSGTGTISLASSQSGLNYYLRDNSNNNMIDGPISGTGSALNFTTGVISSSTDYNVYAERPSSCLAFDGVDDYIDLNQPVLNGLSAFTIEGWFFPKSFNNQSLFGQNDVIETSLSNTDIQLWNVNGGVVTVPHGMSLNNWYHLAFTGDGNTMSVYINGVLSGTVSATVTDYGSFTSSAKIAGFVGDDVIANYSDGKFDEVRFWNYAKTPTEIADKMNTCLSGSESGLLAYYNFEDGSGSNTLTNLTGNINYNGTLTNMDNINSWEQYVCSTCHAQMSSTVSITVDQTPTVTITGNTTICAGKNTILTANGANSYTWSANAGSVTTNTVDVNPTSNDIYTVTAVNGTCSSDFTVSVTVNPLPNVGYIGNDNICAGQTSTLTATGATTYTWNTPLGSAITPSVSGALPSSTSFTLTGFDGSCTNSIVATVTVNPLPNVGYTGNDNICAGQTTTLTGTGATTYTWTSSLGSAVTPSVSGALPSTTSFTLSGHDGTCSKSIVATVTVNPLPAILIGGNTSICNGDHAILTASGANSYTWSANAGSANTNTVDLNPSTNDTYTVTGENSMCTNTKTISITLNSIPSLSITGNYTICSGDIASLTVSGASTYTWSANAGNSTSNQIHISPSSSDSYTVVGANGGCTSTETVAVNVNLLPNVTITGNNSICVGDHSTLTASTSASSYTWSANAGSANTSTIDVNPSTNDTYTVTVDDGMCMNQATITVTVNSIPNINFSGNTTICSGESTTITASGAMSYTWSANAGSVNTNTVNLTPTSNDTYTVTGSNGNCSGPAIVTVVVNSLPSLNFSGNLIICEGNQTTISVSGATSYTWSSNAASVNTNTVQVTPSADETYTVMAFDGNCSNQATVTVTVNTLPIITFTTFGFGTPLCDNAGTQTITGASPAGGTYSGTAVNSNSFDPSVSGTGTFVITYSYTDSNTGCSNTATNDLIVQSCLPTSITETNNNTYTIYPNPGTGLFFVTSQNIMENVLVDIYNIIGEKVLSNKLENIQTTINLESLKNGIYYVKISRDNTILYQTKLVKQD